MNAQSTHALAVWLAENQPRVFEALLRKAAGDVRPQLSGLTDFLTSVGTTFSNAVKAAGSYLSSPDGMKTLSSLGTVYLQTQAQRDALRIQTAQAQAGMQPQPIYSSGQNPNTSVPIYAPTGQLLTPSLSQQLYPQQTMNWTPWLIGGGLLLLLGGLLITRRG